MSATAPVLRDPANRVSSRAPWVWAAGAVLRSLILLAGAVTVDVLWTMHLEWWVWSAYGVIAVGYCTLMPTYRYAVHRWESTSTAVYTQRGWITRERRIAPMSRVQTVDLEQGVVSRLTRLATVTVTTASAAGPLRIEGLDLHVAERLVDELTRRAEAETGDAT